MMGLWPSCHSYLSEREAVQDISVSFFYTSKTSRKTSTALLPTATTSSWAEH